MGVPQGSVAVQPPPVSKGGRESAAEKVLRFNLTAPWKRAAVLQPKVLCLNDIQQDMGRTKPPIIKHTHLNHAEGLWAAQILIWTSNTATGAGRQRWPYLCAMGRSENASSTFICVASSASVVFR